MGRSCMLRSSSNQFGNSSGTSPYGIIKESGGFVVNMPMSSQIELVDGGTISGRDYDKFVDVGLRHYQPLMRALNR